MGTQGNFGRELGLPPPTFLFAHMQADRFIKFSKLKKVKFPILSAVALLDWAALDWTKSKQTGLHLTANWFLVNVLPSTYNRDL